MHEPNIRTYYSSRTEDLVEVLLDQLDNDASSPVNTPFGRAQILVPNSGMQRYLELKIAEKFGICSHIHIGYVGQLLSKTYRQLLSDESPAHLDERLLTFTLLQLWQKKILPLDSAFAKLHQQHQQPRQRYWWANQIAKLLRKYLGERPEMIDAWQRGKTASDHPHELWQRDIFQQLLRALDITHVSRLDLQQRFTAALATPTPNDLPSDLPDVVHVFGFHALPTAQQADLLAVGQATQVIFYTFNPSIAYWQDIVPESVKTRLEITRADEAALVSVGHPLLASWGQSGKYYIEQLSDFFAPNLDEIVAPAVPSSVLTWLQNDIRQLSDDSNDVAALFAEEKTPSITLHACSNPRREVEVLYDNLCIAFENSDLNPADVLVIVPKLGDYAPHIQAIFSRDKNRVSIPYSLANQSSAETDPDVQAFLSLLEVLDNDFQAQLLFEVLSEARIQQALSLTQSQLGSLRTWFADSHYSLHFYDDSDGKNSSLEKLLDSLLLAAVGGEDATLGKRHASPRYHARQRETLLQLCELWQRFVPFVKLKKQTLTLSAWRDKLRQLASAFLPPRHAMDDWINDWYDAISALEARDEKAIFDFATIRADLSSLLQNDILHGPFLSGGVSFCAVVPMRSIPAKMIAVLGLNNDFPSIAGKDPLDVCLARPRWSDRNPHKEQQYFFLETLMAARERLYLSHVGLDEKTGEAIVPSALVRELFGYIARKIPNFADAVTTVYPLQGFASHTSYQSLYNPPDAPDNIDTQPPADETPTPLPDSLTANQLADALLSPLSAYWRYHLGATLLDELAEPLREYEFIAKDSGLDNWQYQQTALEMALTDDHQAPIQSLQQRNLYAPEFISDALLASATDGVQPLASAIEALNLPTEPSAINTLIKTPVGEQSIYLHLHATHYPSQGLLSHHVGKLDAKKLLRSWVNHVLYHCQPDVAPCPSLLLTLNKGKVSETRFTPIANSDEARAQLANLLQVLHAAIQRPYPLALTISAKKDDTALHYVAADYSLYAQIPPADDTAIAAMQTPWQAVDAGIKTHWGNA